MKFVIITGGVVSGLGKGITVSSIGALLQSAGYKLTSIKIDPYLNCDAGTMSPFEHGEVFVLDDGGEGDLDLGNYERFLDINLGKDNNITTGKIYSRVIEAERRGDYLGKTVQIVPHVTDCIRDWIQTVAKTPVDKTMETPEICLIEVGGTVGDIESSVFLEAIRQLIRQNKRSDICLGFVSLVPFIGVVGEQKTKPTQHAVQQLRHTGIFPDFLICRSQNPLEYDTKKKLSLFCDLEESNIIGIHDCKDIYEVPLLLQDQSVVEMILKKLELPLKKSVDLKRWEGYSSIIANELLPVITVAIVGKYVGLEDSYLSVKKGLLHACLEANVRLKIIWIESSDLMKDGDVEKFEKSWTDLKASNCILVPGGFGVRGVEGKILAINYARTHKIPYLGICLGMQLAIIEIYRNVLNHHKGNSTEFVEDCDPVVTFMPEINPLQMGGTMRLGGKKTKLYKYKNGETPMMMKLYGNKESKSISINTVIRERHRHRYEVNPDKIEELCKSGIEFVGKDESCVRMEIIELPRTIHPYFVGVQYHPEFTSRPGNPSPPFLGLILAASNQMDEYIEKKGL